MQKYKIVFSRSAVKELENLSNPIIKRVFIKIESLALNPRPTGIKKLKGQNNIWRMRIGEFRIIYSIDDNLHVIDIIAIRNRKDAYR